ncbi:TOPRIM nucleotidyl transferase/hydrolase domain-containing protein [Nakamurella sp. GG22]
MPAPDEVVVGLRTVVLVEGVSDQRAVEALAERWGRDLAADGVAVLPMQGATNIGQFLQRYGPHGLNLGLAGLCDLAEMRFFQTGFGRAGLGTVANRTELEHRRFFVCDADLEDELIRALGVEAVERVLEERGDLASFRKFQQQPAQQGRSDQARLRRFMGTRGGRKIEYAPVLVNALPLANMPAPLAKLMAAI